MFPTWLLVIAGLIILVLALTAAYFWLKVSRQQKNQRQLQAEQQTALMEKRRNIATDIQFIANAMLEGQCEITEGSIRIASLMKALDTELIQQPEFSAIFALYQNSRQLATHQAYQELSAKERLRQDKIRLTLEDDYSEQILREAKILVSYRFAVLHPH